MRELVFTFPDETFWDWPALHALIGDAFAYMEGRIDPPSSFTRMDVEAFRAKAETELFATCHDGDTLVGAAFADPRGETLYVGKLAVSPVYRKRGIARRLFSMIEDHACANGFTVLELQARIELIENHQTFNALGFIKTAETAHAGYTRPTSVTMQKALS